MKAPRRAAPATYQDAADDRRGPCSTTTALHRAFQVLLELFVVITRKLRPPVAQDAAEAGCDEIWTEDLATGSRIRGTAIVNPFAAD